MANNYQSHSTHYRIKQVKYANGDVKYQIQQKGKYLSQALFWLLVLLFTIATLPLQLLFIVLYPNEIFRAYVRIFLATIMQWHDIQYILDTYTECEAEIKEQIKEEDNEYAIKQFKKQQKIEKKLSNKVISTSIIE
jgi:hypothetical protein